MKTIETNDVYKGAYLLCTKATLKAVHVQKNKRVVFVFFGEETAQEDWNYRSGQGLVNPQAYKQGINYLRDLISETLKARRNYGKDSRRENLPDQETSRSLKRGSKARHCSKQERAGVQRALPVS